MKKLIFLASASLALAACGSGADDTATPTDSTPGEEIAAVEAASEAASDVEAMPTEALSGEAAATAMHDRHEWFEEMGDAFKLLMRQSKSDSPDMEAVKEPAALIAEKSTILPSLFAPGTGPEAGKTEAKANIWERPDDFMDKARNFHLAAANLNAVAQSGDAVAFKEAFGKAGGTCKACHDDYREED